MTANVTVVVEREFGHPRLELFRAWTEPAELAEWCALPGWHVDPGTVRSDLRVGGRHHHVKVRDDDPTVRVTTDAVITEYLDPDGLVAWQRITGDPTIDPDVPLELRVEFAELGRDDMLVRVVQGPFEPEVAGCQSRRWELELDRLERYLTGRRQTVSGLA